MSKKKKYKIQLSKKWKILDKSTKLIKEVE